MGLYIKQQQVEIRLAGKVRFTDDVDDENLMPYSLLRRLIAEAEGQVEFDLSPRFEAPFQTYDGKPFNQLPERPTKEYLRTLCEVQSVIRVLETDFGRGAVSAEDYTKSLADRYKVMLDKVIARRNDDDDQNQWKYPPLRDLRLAYHNTEADDGFRGMVINTSDKESFAQNQINSPGATFWNVTFSDIYGDEWEK